MTDKLISPCPGHQMGALVIPERQLPVLRSLVAGKTDKAIARETGLAVKTVQGTVSKMQRAAGVYATPGTNGRVALAVLAVRNGLVE